ncbi:MAG: ATP-binding protein, partial [Rectinemataceae bacterium]
MKHISISGGSNMAKRQIIEIDEETCTGCGDCATGCPEGALRIIDGKARMVGENLCDGLGACIGTCPVGAITIVEREAEPYDEAKVMEGIAKLGHKVIAAHLEHLSHHGQDLYVRQALEWMEGQGIETKDFGFAGQGQTPHFDPCPGSASRRFTPLTPKTTRETVSVPVRPPSTLASWPIQLHLINPRAAQFADADILVAADCTAFALGSFRADILSGKSLVIACPKLDQGREVYIDKLTSLFANARSVTVAIMEVPCCSGLLKLALEARDAGSRKPALDTVVVGIQGE